MLLRAIILSLGIAAPPPAGGAATSERTGASHPVLLAAADCSQAAAEVAAETGGRVLSVRSAVQGGRPVCIVQVVVSSGDGKRPRRSTIVVPQ